MSICFSSDLPPLILSVGPTEMAEDVTYNLGGKP